MNKGTMKRGFGSHNIKPVVRQAELLPAGKHDVRIVSAEYEMPKENEEYTRSSDEKQLKVVMRNVLGIITAWLNSMGFVRGSELDKLSTDDLPSDINYKAIGITKAEFAKLSLVDKFKKLVTISSDGYAVRKDTRERLISQAHSDEAASFAGSCLGAAGIAEDEEYDEDQLPSLLIGKVVRVKVSEREWEGNTNLKVTGFNVPSDEAIEELAELS